MTEALARALDASVHAPGLPWVRECPARLAQAQSLWAPQLGLALLAQDPSSAQAMIYLVQSEAHLGHQDEAWLWAERAHEVAPGNRRLTTILDSAAAAAGESGKSSAERSERQ